MHRVDARLSFHYADKIGRLDTDMKKNYSRKFELVSNALQFASRSVCDQMISRRQLCKDMRSIQASVASILNDMAFDGIDKTHPTAVKNLKDMYEELFHLQIDITDGVVSDNDVCKTIKCGQEHLQTASKLIDWAGKMVTVKVKSKK